MNDIKALLATWNSDTLNNPSSLESLSQALTLLVDRVETLEAEVAELRG
jgi:hypothetical protein